MCVCVLTINRWYMWNNTCVWNFSMLFSHPVTIQSIFFSNGWIMFAWSINIILKFIPLPYWYCTHIQLACKWQWIFVGVVSLFTCSLVLVLRLNRMKASLFADIGYLHSMFSFSVRYIFCSVCIFIQCIQYIAYSCLSHFKSIYDETHNC